MTRKPAEALFALDGLEGIASQARALLDGEIVERRAVVNRWIVRSLDLCARTFCCPPPPELVDLVAKQLRVAGTARGERQNWEKFSDAARYVAQHPEATPAQIARAIDYDQKRQISRWQADPEFDELVKLNRLYKG
jgi:hypothetical protein